MATSDIYTVVTGIGQSVREKPNLRNEHKARKPRNDDTETREMDVGVVAVGGEKSTSRALYRLINDNNESNPSTNKTSIIKGENTASSIAESIVLNPKSTYLNDRLGNGTGKAHIDNQPSESHYKKNKDTSVTNRTMSGLFSRWEDMGGDEDRYRHISDNNINRTNTGFRNTYERVASQTRIPNKTKRTSEQDLSHAHSPMYWRLQQMDTRLETANSHGK
jgi:hypothetical protein